MFEATIAFYSPSDLLWGPLDIVEPDAVASAPDPEVTLPPEAAADPAPQEDPAPTPPTEFDFLDTGAVADPADPLAPAQVSGDVVIDLTAFVDAFDYDTFAETMALDFGSLLLGFVTTEPSLFG